MTEASGWQASFLKALALVGVNPEEVSDGERNFQTNYEQGSSRVAIALVSDKIALAFSGDDTEELEQNGWSVIRFAVGDLDPFGRVMDGILAVRREREIANLTTPKQTSRAEEMLLARVVEAGLPLPVRDKTFRDDDTGREITVPDFTWEEMKFAVYVDGGYWHHGKDVVEALDPSKREAQEAAKRVTLRNEKDADNRRILQSKFGYELIACSAEKITDDPDYLTSVVTDIVAIYHRRYAENKARARFGSAADAADLL